MEKLNIFVLVVSTFVLIALIKCVIDNIIIPLEANDDIDPPLDYFKEVRK